MVIDGGEVSGCGGDAPGWGCDAAGLGGDAAGWGCDAAGWGCTATVFGGDAIVDVELASDCMVAVCGTEQDIGGDGGADDSVRAEMLPFSLVIYPLAHRSTCPCLTFWR